jgi:hypothetical protein
MIAAALMIGSVIGVKSRLQAALDRGMYAGAARLSFLMNQSQNWPGSSIRAIGILRRLCLNIPAICE